MSGVENSGFERNNIDEDLEKDRQEIVAVLSEDQNDTPNKIEQKKDPNLMDKISAFLTENKSTIKFIFKFLVHCAVIVYFGFATSYYIKNKNSCNGGTCPMGWCDGYGFLILMCGITYLGMVYYQIKKYFGKRIYRSLFMPIGRVLQRVFKRTFMKLAAVAVVIAAFLVYVVFETSEERDRLRSLAGIGSILLVGTIFSKYRSNINWRPVILGVIMQIILGLIIIQWDVGRAIFDCLGDKVKIFLGYATEGALFVYGTEIIGFGVFAFAILSVIFFFSLMISMLYYLGAMQWVVMSLGWILQSTLGTTVCESVNAAANIFLGQSESPLLIRPYIDKLTHSELHTIMSSGFATVAGTVLAAYISFGANPAHLITASVMAAPASLCLSKLLYPETEKSLTTTDNIQMEKSPSSSLLDAATKGALDATELVLGIIANLIAFVAFIAFFNGVLDYFGGLVGIQDLTLELIFGKIFIPVAWLIGVPWDDCETVAKIIGIKSVINEFVAFQRLGEEIDNGLTPRSAAIATFAICGFANPSSLGILIGSLSAMAPQKRTMITAVAFRAMITGTLVCFMTASIAGLLMNESHFVNFTNNSTTTDIPSTTEEIFM